MVQPTTRAVCMASAKGDDELKLALEALTASIPIVTSTKVASAKAGKYIIAHLDCGCRPSDLQAAPDDETQRTSCRVRPLAYAI